MLAPRRSSLTESPKIGRSKGRTVFHRSFSIHKKILLTGKKKRKKFSFTNETKYKKYRLNITSNIGNSLFSLGAFEMYNNLPVTPTPDPSTTPGSSDTDEASQATGDRAILTVTMGNGLIKNSI
ncbi:hypothetical protein D3C74_342280 [compost metagenome]